MVRVSQGEMVIGGGRRADTGRRMNGSAPRAGSVCLFSRERSSELLYYDVLSSILKESDQR